MKCMCAQTRSRFILTSEGVFGGMEFEPMLTPREKSPLPENVPRGGSNPRCNGPVLLCVAQAPSVNRKGLFSFLPQQINSEKKVVWAVI